MTLIWTPGLFEGVVDLKIFLLTLDFDPMLALTTEKCLQQAVECLVNFLIHHATLYLLIGTLN